MTLVDVYSAPEAARVLYDLLAEREPQTNISHKAMPTWDEHVRFVASKPYQAWYLLEVDDGNNSRTAPPQIVGAIYLTKPAAKARAGDEIGVFVFKAHRGKGYGKAAIKALMSQHGKRRYLANIAPGNAASIKLFDALGFRHIQNTYEG